MDDSIIEKIKNNISNNLSKINTNTFITKIKNSSSVEDCISISNEFFESFKEAKLNIISFKVDKNNLYIYIFPNILTTQD